MALIVQKFGGSSVKDRDRIFNVARIVANTHNAGTVSYTHLTLPTKA